MCWNKYNSRCCCEIKDNPVETLANESLVATKLFFTNELNKKIISPSKIEEKWHEIKKAIKKVNLIFNKYGTPLKRHRFSSGHIIWPL